MHDTINLTDYDKRDLVIRMVEMSNKNGANTGRKSGVSSVLDEAIAEIVELRLWRDKVFAAHLNLDLDI